MLQAPLGPSHRRFEQTAGQAPQDGAGEGGLIREPRGHLAKSVCPHMRHRTETWPQPPAPWKECSGPQWGSEPPWDHKVPEAAAAVRQGGASGTWAVQTGSVEQTPKRSPPTPAQPQPQPTGQRNRAEALNTHQADGNTMAPKAGASMMKSRAFYPPSNAAQPKLTFWISWVVRKPQAGNC